jgi:DNA repair exonuclease SbcCD nuclease subunit
MSVRFIHTADWQLGRTRHRLSEKAQARFSQARIDASRTVGRTAQETGAAFIVASGDVFETNRVDPRTVCRALKALDDVPVPVLLLPGNHDPLDAASVFRSLTFLRDMHGETRTGLGPVRRVRGRPSPAVTSHPASVANAADAVTRPDQAARGRPKPARIT